MIKLNIAKFARLNRWLQWQKRTQGIIVRFPEDQLSLHVLFFVHKNICFKHMILSMNLQKAGVSYPADIDQQSSVYDFLMDQTKPLAVQITLKDGTKRFLRNKACDGDLKVIKNCIQDPKSIYGYLRNYLGPQIKYDLTFSRKTNYFLNQFYLRLSAQTYFKTMGVKQNTVIDQKLKQQVLNYIGEEYQNHSPASIRKTMGEIAVIESKINQTNAQINKIQKQADAKIAFYKFGAILATCVHIISFGYMIFFVEWLGWDIIQPLTYSAGVAYTLLGIRFYRKYRTDRTGDSIRQTLLKLVMKPQKLVALKDLRFRLTIQQNQLKRAETRLRLLKNHVNFHSSLAESYS